MHEDQVERVNSHGHDNGADLVQHEATPLANIVVRVILGGTQGARRSSPCYVLP